VSTLGPDRGGAGDKVELVVVLLAEDRAETGECRVAGG
jgi:hypothetical protein